MTKELETIKSIKDVFEFLKLERNNSLMKNIGKKGIEDINILEKALTPPTEEQVCKALSDYYGYEIIYKGLDFFPKERLSTLYCVVAMVDGCIDFADPLPPELITMICRFYEGVKKGG